MKIFNSTQLKEWDQYTISHEPISSQDLMERAAIACTSWLITKTPASAHFRIFCGRGNNGGDGLAIARLLLQHGLRVFVYVIDTAGGSIDFQANFEKIRGLTDNIILLLPGEPIPDFKESDIIIDALVGTGLKRKLDGKIAEIAVFINNCENQVISVDIPSGLFTDKFSDGIVIKADYTLTFQTLKLCFLVGDNEKYFGIVEVLPINLHQEFFLTENSVFELTEKKNVKAIFKPRDLFSHKGNYGFACIVAGSYGMMGAAVLATRACLRSGAGKVKSVVCRKGYEILQVTAPEALTEVSGTGCIKKIENPGYFDAIGIGPGLGLHDSHEKLLSELFKHSKGPLVIDADALTILSKHPKLFDNIPAETIITPHPKEFDRLFGNCSNSFERLDMARKMSVKHKLCIVLKGHFTAIVTPYGKTYFNSTGNPGMATGGTGDVLTGILTGLLAQGYSASKACILGVYVHGMAGDIAASLLSEEALVAGDIIDQMGSAFRSLQDID